MGDRKNSAFDETIGESLPGLFYVIDGNQRFQLWNTNFSRVSGYSDDEIATMSPLDFFRGQDKDLIAERVGRVFTEGESTAEADFVTKAGLAIPHFFTGRSMVFRGARCLVGLGIDVSYAREAGRALKTSEERYRSIVENALVGIYITNVQGQILYANETGWKTIYECKSFEEFAASGIRDFYRNPEMRAAFFETLREQGFIHNVEVETVTRTGKTKTVSIYASISGDLVTTLALDITPQRLAEEGRRISEEKFAKAFYSSPDAILITRMTDGRISDVNEGFCRLTEYSRENAIGKSTTDLQLWIGDDRNAFLALISKEGRIQEREYRFRTKSGRIIDTIMSAEVMQMGNEALLLGTVRDITAKKEAERTLHETEARYRAVFHGAAVGITRVSRDGKWIEVNPKFCEMLGYTAEELLTLKVSDVTHAEDESMSRLRFDRLVSGDAPAFRYEKKYIRKNGASLYAEVAISAVLAADGTFDYAIGIVNDLSERRRFEATLDFVTKHDALTGLPNASGFKAQLDAAINRTAPCAVAIINLDKFGNLNRTLGTDKGDFILREAAQRILGRTAAEPGCSAARLGADIFGLCVPLPSPEAGGAIPAQIRALLQEPFVIDDLTVHVTASVGIALFPLDATDSTGLLRNAESALVHARRAGRETVRFYSGEMNQRAREILEIETALRTATQRNELFLLYQPQIDCTRGLLSGFEALVRWRRPGDEIVSPAEFIPLAEENGQILDIGRWVLADAVRQAQTWLRGGLPIVPIAVNVSARQFADETFIPFVLDAVESAGLPRNTLELEITESAVVGDERALVQMLSPLAEAGISLALDDFGTGYSSLARLRNYPIDKLKIDRSLVTDIAGDRSALGVACSIISLAQNLGLRSIAEGVETQEQTLLLRANKCWGLQGFFFHPPLSAEHAADLMRTGRRHFS